MTPFSLRSFFEFLFPLTTHEKEVLSLTPSSARRVLPPAAPTPHPWIHSLFSYRDERVRALIHLIKYRNNRQALDAAGALMAEEVLARAEEDIESGSKPLLLLPIPMHPHRLRERGWNQAEELAHALYSHASFTEIDTSLLQKITHTPHQISLPRRERLSNVRNSFRVTDSSRLSGHSVILIDDVTTTGATLAEARDILLSNGTQKVEALTLAH